VITRGNRSGNKPPRYRNKKGEDLRKTMNNKRAEEEQSLQNRYG